MNDQRGTNLRFLFQFRIRTLLILIVAASVFTRFGYLSWRQAKDVEIVRENGGKVFYDSESPEYAYASMFGLPNTREIDQTGIKAWLRNTLGKAFVDNVKVVYFGRGFAVGNGELIDALNRLTDTKILSIRSPRLGNRGSDFGFFDKLRIIERLSLFEWNRSTSTSRFTTDLTPFSKLKRLKTLSLSATQIRDLSQLQGLKELEQLHLPFAKLVNLEQLEPLTNLNWLNFDPSDVRDFSPLANLPNLEVLRFGLADVPQETLAEIRLLLPKCKVGR